MGEFAAGSVFAGHRIEAVAGRGGMGVVYRARQLSLDRTVALKVIAPALMEDPAIRRRFVRESKVAASIDHPNVIPIYYAGEEQGVAFIAMRHVAGDDLRTLLRREGPLDPARAARILAQIATALDAAHAAGLVHRDVKPANVLLGDGDHAYLTDFGLTKHVLSEGGATRPGHWVGTLDFVAPEQIRGERIDARADVYGLGCLLHYSLTGRPPFAHDTDEAKLWAHLSEPPPSVSDQVAGAPQAFDAVIARALAKLPADRYQSAGDLGRAALAASAGEDVTERERVVAVGAAAPVEAETRTAATALAPAGAAPPATQGQGADSRPRRRRARVLTAAAVTLIVAAVAAGAALWPDRDAAERSPGAGGGVAQDPQVAATVTVAPRPNALAAAGGRIWVGSFRTDRLAAIDPRTGEVVRGLRPRVGIGLQELWQSGSSLWVLVSRDRRLLRLDARTGRSVGPTVALPASATALAVGDGSVWVTVRVANVEGGGDELLRIDARTGAIEETFPVRDSVQRMVVARGALWMLSPRPTWLVRHDLDTGKRRRVRLEGSIPGDLAWGGGSLWAGLTDTDQLARVDPRTGNVATVAVGQGPAGIVVKGDDVWVANRASSTLSRVDVRTGRLRGEPVEVPLNPYELAASGDSVWAGSLAEGKVVQVTSAGPPATAPDE